MFNTDELDDDFTGEEVKESYIGTTRNKATGCEGTPAEARKMLVTEDEASDVLMTLFNAIKNKSYFPTE